jgi:hypothetical protein
LIRGFFDFTEERIAFILDHRFAAADRYRVAAICRVKFAWKTPGEMPERPKGLPCQGDIGSKA